MVNDFNKNKLSVIIITLNEERNIARCINSIIKVADEIIVVDSNSTDNTANICKQFNVRFFSFTWRGYSETKNYGNSLATYDFVLSIDADEALSETLINSIKEAKHLGFTGVYSMNRLTNYCGKWVHHTSWYPDAKIRIFNTNSTTWEGDVHEVLKYTDKPIKHHLHGDILHYSFYSIEEHKQKLEKYASIAAKSMHSKGKTFSYIKWILNPALKFIKDYIIRLGFLDGRVGFIVSRMNAYGTFMKYEMYRKML